jgi:hypothetical protein
MRTSTVTGLAKGMFRLNSFSSSTDISLSILEYLSRDDAERAVKELDGKDLRGNSVKVSMDTSEVSSCELRHECC